MRLSLAAARLTQFGDRKERLQLCEVHGVAQVGRAHDLAGLAHGGVLDGAIIDIKLSRLFVGPTAAEIAG